MAPGTPCQLNETALPSTRAPPSGLSGRGGSTVVRKREGAAVVVMACKGCTMLGRRLLDIVKENADGRGLDIVELSVTDSPAKSSNAETGEDEGERYEEVQDNHGTGSGWRNEG